jgi:catechol 2,3-dioxygenase-like lactoylglutathione lyase family enzyme
MLLVADLARSVAFYRDKLDFRVVDETPGGAVLEFHGGRMLLQRRVDMSPVERRLSHLLFSVSDVDATYAELRSRGVEFLHRPKLISRVGELELWGATVRDPDGHAIALAQWRDRADASR